MSRSIAIPVIVAVFLSAGVARADDLVFDQLPESDRVTESYRSSMMIADAAAWGLWLTAIALDDSDAHVQVPFLLAGTGAMLLGGPIVHWSQGNITKGLGSLALRVSVPVVMFYGSMIVTQGEYATGALGGLVGLIGVQLFDAFYLAKRQRHVDGPVARASRTTWSPTFAISSEVKTVGLAGRF